MLSTKNVLSKSTVSKIDWNAIHGSAIGIRSRSAEIKNPVAPSSQEIQAVFEKAQTIFSESVASLEHMTKTMYWIVGGTIAVVVAAIIIGQFVDKVFERALTTGFSLAGVIVLLAVAYRLINAHRDIVILKLAPTKYAMAIQLASTEEQKNKLFDGFMKDLESLQAGESLADSIFGSG